MDSMRHLSTSLPPASSRRSDPPPDLLSDFKAAALSVTNLFKTAASAQTKARAAGYQDALDDLLAFLDKENLGLMDGEGWRVRQWATERLDGDGSMQRGSTGGGSTMTDDEEETSTVKDDEKDEERSSSPELQRKPDHQSDMSSSQMAEDDNTLRHRRVVSEPPHHAQIPPAQHDPPHHPSPPNGDFTFQSAYAYPHNHDRDASGSGMELDGSGTPPPPPASQPPSAPSSADTVRIVPRPPRGTRHPRRHESRLPSLNINLGSGAGSKRKVPFPDFFDISGFHDGSERKDGGGSGRGGKRGRHV